MSLCVASSLLHISKFSIHYKYTNTIEVFNTVTGIANEPKVTDIYQMTTTIFTLTEKSLKSTFTPLLNLHICRIVMDASHQTVIKTFVVLYLYPY